MGRSNRRRVIWTFVIIGAAVVAFVIANIHVRRDFIVNLGGNYSLHRFNDSDIFVAPTQWDDKTPIIPARVAELDHDDRFAIAKQQHLRQRNIGIPNDTLMEPDPNAFSYWILRFHEPRVWGPMTQAEFDAQRQTLGVTPSLKLHDVYDYQPY